MNLANLFKGHGRSETTFLLGLKIFTMIMILACLTGYLAVIIIEIKQDVPVTVTSFVNVDAIRPPNLHISSAYNISFFVCVENYSINNKYTPAMCSPEDTSVFFNDSLYVGNYQPSKDVIFRKKTLNSIGLIISINEEITLEKTWDMTLIAFDSEYDLMFTHIPNYSKNYDDNILVMNMYTMEPNQAYLFTYTRIIKELISPSWMNDFGVPPTYERKPSISSNLVGGPLQTKDGGNVQIIIQPKYNNIVQVDKEVRSHTYLGGLGLVGGAWGLAAAIYAFLFGADALRPWGAVHLYCCGFSRSAQRRFRNASSNIPFFDTSDPNTLSLAEQNRLLRSRIDSLELFLQEYVIDVQFLDKIRKLNQSMHNDDNATTIATTEPLQQEESSIITMPPNLNQNSTTDDPTTTIYTADIADTADKSQDDSSSQQNTFITQQQ
ncbi:hypothetical protein C1645_823489 [Glomus cerebriforme]|uniref:Uncharacterized protein n=1 Tax=Glomus cerebriforme TaxID=658196 RepID=A0A397SWI5_9GLOM|nr:hypothetical protein C1645_823489 [Glomus cerebriforme]